MRQDLSSRPTSEFKKPPAGSIGGLHGGVSCEFLCLSSLLFLALTSQSQVSSEEVDLPILLGNVLLQQLVLLQDLLDGDYLDFYFSVTRLATSSSPTRQRNAE